MGVGNNTERDAKTGLKKWTIEWQNADLAIVDGHQSGTMNKVKGTVFDSKGNPASTFAADHAEADKAVNRLLLEGAIEITSITKKAKMTAKKVEWLPDLEVLKASGDVLIEGEMAVVGPVSQIFVSPNLKKSGSQQYFKRIGTSQEDLKK